MLFPNYLSLASQIAIAALFALSLDLILGYAGIVSLGHAAFFGIGAYTAGLFSKFVWGEPLTGLIVGSRGGGTGRLCLQLHHRALPPSHADHDHARPRPAAAAKRRNSAGWLTGGIDGLQGIDIWPLLGMFKFDLYGKTAYGYSLAVLFLVFLGARRLIHSPFGLALRGIRENWVRMPAIGAASRAHIRKIYTIAAAIAGIAGALIAQTTSDRVAGSARASSAPPTCW